MKKNRNYLSILTITMVAMLSFNVTACNNDDDEGTNEPPYLNVSKTMLNARGSVPFSETFSINTNQGWTISNKPTWVSLDATEGVGSQDITATINSSDKNYRSGNIVVTSIDNLSVKTIEVRQNGNTLSAVTGDYKGSIVTKGAFLGTDKKTYEYEHKITVEFSINGSHLASNYGVTGSTIQGALSDGIHSTTITLYSNRASTSFTYRAFVTSKSTGAKLYGIEKTIVSSQN